VAATSAPASTAQIYRGFARQEARGRSPAYEALAEGVAGDPEILRFLDALPPQKRQPNLLFAAARYLLGAPADLAALRALVRSPGTSGRPGRSGAWGTPGRELAEVMLARRTQTNEPARCALLLPALAQLPQPLALIEVGASAGLTLLVDRYSYDYGGHRIAGLDPDAPTLRCEPEGPVPLPQRPPQIAWRAGLDLNPLSVASQDDVQWLTCLVWPGEGDRQERLAAAIATARRDPPSLRRGDLIDDLPALAAGAPAGATLVVYHSAVLAYVEPERRRVFAGLVRDLGATWLSNEGPRVLADVPVESFTGDPFLLVRDGQTPLAVADGHGAWLRWLG
jgi:hypothetical protein